MYADINFKTKKELKESVESGQEIGVYNPSGMFAAPQDGTVVVEGPHYPKPHRWWASCRLVDGLIVSVK